MFIEVPAAIWLLISLAMLLVALLAVGMLRAAAPAPYEVEKEDWQDEQIRSGKLRAGEFDWQNGEMV